jgi:hypothetical protein
MVVAVAEPDVSEPDAVAQPGHGGGRDGDRQAGLRLDDGDVVAEHDEVLVEPGDAGDQPVERAPCPVCMPFWASRSRSWKTGSSNGRRPAKRTMAVKSWAVVCAVKSRPIWLPRYRLTCGRAATSTPAPARPAARAGSPVAGPSPTRVSTTALVSQATAIGANASASMTRT